VRVANCRFLTTWIFEAPIESVEGLTRDLGCALVAAS
jgi:hypothetical protein